MEWGKGKQKFWKSQKAMAEVKSKLNNSFIVRKIKRGMQKQDSFDLDAGKSQSDPGLGHRTQ